MIELNNKIIKKIINLQKIDMLELMRYGLEHEFINTKFCSETAIELISQNIIVDNADVLELASWIPVKHEEPFEEGHSILIKATKSTDLTYRSRHQLYNKIWFYLFQANELINLGIID